MAKIIKKGFIIRIPVIVPMTYPKTIKKIKLNIIVASNPIKSSFNLSDFWIFGAIVPI